MSEMGAHAAALAMVAHLEGENGKRLTDRQRKNLAIDIQTANMQRSEPGSKLYEFSRTRWLELLTQPEQE